MLKDDICLNFTDGDLIFGTNEAREPYIKQVKRRLNPSAPIVIEELNFFNGIFILSDKISPKDTLELTMYQLNHLLFIRANETLITKNLTKTRQVEFRICKLIALHAKANGRKIHFILDGIDHHRVVYKTNNKESEYSCTSCELRALYRAWNYIKDDNVYFFYMGGKRVMPPWEAPATLLNYLTYNCFREAKGKIGKKPNLFTEVHSIKGKKLIKSPSVSA